MQRVFERVMLALVLVSVVMTVVGLIANNNTTLVNAGLICLMVITVAFAAVQVGAYVKNDKPDENKKVLAFALVSSVVAIGIICVGTLMLLGKLL